MLVLKERYEIMYLSQKKDRMHQGRGGEGGI